MPKDKRVFFSVPLSLPVKNKIRRILDQCNFFGRREAEEKWHITLNFIGNIVDSDLGKLSLIGREVAQKTEIFDIEIGGLKYMPSSDHPRMLWAEVKKNKKLADLKKLLDDKIFEAGISYGFNHSVYSPHITLIKFNIKNWWKLPKEIDKKIDLKMPIVEFDLMESVLDNHNLDYQILDKYELQW